MCTGEQDVYIFVQKTIPLKNYNNFVTGKYIWFKIYTHIAEAFLRIPAKFSEDISNRTKNMVGQRKKFKFYKKRPKTL